MLTVTFIANDIKTVVSCASYSVTPLPGGKQNVRVWDTLKGESSEDFLMASDDDEAFPVAFVTNLAGKTIDRIGG